jgi:hypothetical protein
METICPYSSHCCLRSYECESTRRGVNLYFGFDSRSSFLSWLVCHKLRASCTLQRRDPNSGHEMGIFTEMLLKYRFDEYIGEPLKLASFCTVPRTLLPLGRPKWQAEGLPSLHFIITEMPKFLTYSSFLLRLFSLFLWLCPVIPFPPTPSFLLLLF